MLNVLPVFSRNHTEDHMTPILKLPSDVLYTELQNRYPCSYTPFRNETISIMLAWARDFLSLRMRLFLSLLFLFLCRLGQSFTPQLLSSYNYSLDDYNSWYLLLTAKLQIS